jgi:ABC-type uncharacterized transport system permease subunit
MPKALEVPIITIMALFLSVGLIAVFILLAGQNPLDVFYTIYRGAFGSWFSWQNTLVRSAPLLLTALCTALPARAGLIVIGGEGAVVIGGLFAAITGFQLSGADPLLVLSAMLISGSLAGGLWIAGVGALKHYRGVNETISSLLLNYIAIAVLNFLVVGMLKDPSSLNKPSTHSVGPENMLGAMGESSIHWGFGFGLIICAVLWFICQRTTFGYALSVVGGNPRTARLAGMNVGKVIIISCFLGGIGAGLAGAVEVAAVHGRANISLVAGYGYAGILVAFLARHNPLAIILFAILLGGIQASGGLLQRSHGLPDATVAVIQGLIFVVILASEMFYGRLNPLFRLNPFRKQEVAA